MAASLLSNLYCIGFFLGNISASCPKYQNACFLPFGPGASCPRRPVLACGLPLFWASHVRLCAPGRRPGLTSRRAGGYNKARHPAAKAPGAAPCRCRTTASTSAFQADDVGSTPITCSKPPQASYRLRRLFCALLAFCRPPFLKIAIPFGTCYNQINMGAGAAGP